jgi:enoyl-CoA hydratase
VDADGSIRLEVRDRIGVITLDRPERRNALSTAMVHALAERLEEADGSDEVDVVVLTGTDPAFCAGLDLTEMAATGANLRPGDGHPWPSRTKPLLGAVNGPAVTGGLELALACDFLIASDRAAFADTHTRVGLVPFWGLSVRLPQAVGVRRAREMSLTGNFIDAERALAWGLVNRVVPHHDLLPLTMALASDISTADQAATREIVTAYAAYAGGGPDAERAELVAAERFLGAGIDPAVIEARRLALLERSRRQRGG